nr:alpha-(1,3)-fucosyltransferase 11-like [Lytechinus pictus]
MGLREALVRQRKNVPSDKGKTSVESNQTEPAKKDHGKEDLIQDDDAVDGVDWKCGMVILLLVFVIVFLGSMTLGSRFALPISLFSRANVNDQPMGQTEQKSNPTFRDQKPSESRSFHQGHDDSHVWEANDDEISMDEILEHSKDQRINGKAKLKKDVPKIELDKPTILWWTDSLFPHAHRGHISEINCGEHTCLSTSDKKVLPDPLTRGILFYGTDFRTYEAPLPRKPWHEWALLHEESPMNNYALVHGMRLFNHTATFKRISDYPITTHSLTNLEYLTERKPVPIEVKNRLRKNKFAPILYVQSHCDVAADRDRFVKELMKHIKVDSYGQCLNNKKIPEHLSDPVDSMESEQFYDFISKYKFHLAFENAICDDYITEKFFRPFHVGSVPIYKGSPSAHDWAPSKKSFINVDQFDSPEQLAYFIELLDTNDDIYLDYLSFKERGITNKALLDNMNDRDFAINEWNRHSFISGFECHVCKKISERYKAELDPSRPAPEKKMGDNSHMGCPPPEPSVGDIADIPATDGIHNWIQDYWGMRDQVVALEEMIKNGEKDSSKLFEFMEKIYYDNDNHQP